MSNSIFQATLMRRANAVIVSVAAIWIFLLPGAILTRDLADPALRRRFGAAGRARIRA